MNYDKIQAALEVRTQALSGNHEIVYEDYKYVPKTNTPFIRTRFMPIDRRPASCGVGADLKPYMQKYEGVFQLLLNMPEGRGTRETNNLVNEICDKFEAATDISFGGVYLTIKQVERMRGISDTPWYKTPVNVHWYSYAK